MDGYDIETVQLLRGIKVGDTWERVAVLREASVADILDAHRQGRNAVEAGIRMTLRRVVSIGGLKGPLTPELVQHMTAEDLRRLQEGCERVDARVRGPVVDEEGTGEQPTF